MACEESTPWGSSTATKPPGGPRSHGERRKWDRTRPLRDRSCARRSRRWFGARSHAPAPERRSAQTGCHRLRFPRTRSGWRRAATGYAGRQRAHPLLGWYWRCA
ncbi:hypothetical protein GOP47_0017164 [Adiantum capillus-veneris]|uniref:Uncharacterized protein n=1 Tax=Adiantum capillus-veneris TaxID=13818 RepID=A0A9D4UJT4_ADICA|nr:hypothetical protein GOP47_0017164 [Adiantum capillus-veneris]